MPGVLALLDPIHSAKLEALWSTMSRDFGVPHGYPGAIPHITFHLGNHDIEAGADEVVAAVAQRTPPLVISTSGLGIFGGTPPVFHLTVTRTQEVAALAADLTHTLAAAGFPSSDPYFAPEKWIPHITIAHKNLAGIELGPLLTWLVAQPLAWEIQLATLSIARETELSAEILTTFPLAG